jgi:rhamnosyltransferase
VLIPTKNGGPLFKEVVRGLRAQTCWDRVEFLVVDSGSTDDTVAVARAAGARCVSIPPAQFNHGTTRDYGISLATTGRVVLLVQDAVPQSPHMIETLLAALEKDRIAGVYGRQIPRANADVVTRRNLNSHFTGRLAWQTNFIADCAAYARLAPAEKRALCNFDNVCSAVRKDVWAEEKFGAADFGEDINWAERVLKRGYGITYEPAAAVIHSHDRPLAYEYDRAYVCHRTLYRQFGLEQVPTLPKALMAWGAATLRDWAAIVQDESSLISTVTLMAKAPLVNAVLIRAKYHAERDEKGGIHTPGLNV